MCLLVVACAPPPAVDSTPRASAATNQHPQLPTTARAYEFTTDAGAYCVYVIDARVGELQCDFSGVTK